MKILHLFPYLPTPKDFGGALRIYHILRHLYENHEVTVAGFSDSGDMNLFYNEFPDLRKRSHFLKRPFKKRFRRLTQMYSCLSGHSSWYTMAHTKQMQLMLNELTRREQFDIVQSEFPTMGSYNLRGDAIKILDAHNVEYDNFRRMSEIQNSVLRKHFYEREFRKFRIDEIDSGRRQDAIFTTSERDSKIFDRHLPEKPKFIIPNGVDTDYFHPGSTTPEPNSLVFTGMMGYVPNYDGIGYFLDEVLPIIARTCPDVKVYIVGKNPPKDLLNRATDQIIVTGFVDDVRPYVYRSSVYIVPLRMGGGTRLKIMEALAMKKPIVTTSIGCEGIDVEDKENVLIADDAYSFAHSVLELFGNRTLADKLISNGHELVSLKYDWKVIGDMLDQAYYALTDKNVISPSVQSSIKLYP